MSDINQLFSSIQRAIQQKNGPTLTKFISLPLSESANKIPSHFFNVISPKLQEVDVPARVKSILGAYNEHYQSFISNSLLANSFLSVKDYEQGI